MLFFKTYSNSVLATFLSILGSLALIFGVIGVISFFTAGMKDSGNIIAGLVCVGVWYGLSKAAKAIAEKKASND